MPQNKKMHNETGKGSKIANNGVDAEFREHCPFKDDVCNYFGRGWYDRCVWCKDNNGFIRKIDDKSKPY